MASAKLFLDTRAGKKDGTFPVKIYVTHGRGVNARVATGISVKENEWFNDKVVASDMAYRYNTILQKMIGDVRVMLLNKAYDGSIEHMDSKALREAVEETIRPESVERKARKRESFLGMMGRFIATKHGRTREIYENTRKKVYEFDRKCTIDSITPSWLMEFDASMEGLSTNTRAINMRNIRAVINFLIDDGAEIKYPFRKFRIKREETMKRSLTIEQIRAIRDYPCDAVRKPFIDMFMLMVYLVGINSADLFNLTSDSIVDGRLEYRRKKTGRLYSIKLEPEAMEIINRYVGKDRLLSVCERYSRNTELTRHINDALKSLGTGVRMGRRGTSAPLFPKASTYYARHSWATIAYSIGIPMETISDALGHQYGSKITGVYIRKDLAGIDMANRKVLDALK